MTYNVFGWQKPCYLLVDEGYAASFKELMEETPWDQYGTGNNPKCDNCMAHCGYEGTAVDDMFANPLKGLKVWLKGSRLDGPLAPEVPIRYKRQAADVIPLNVQPRENSPEKEAVSR